MPTETAADSAIKLSLIKARNELGDLLAQEKKKGSKLEAENERLSARMKRFKGNLDAARERGEKEKEAAVNGAREKLVKEFLPVLDSLERAMTVELGDLDATAAKSIEGLRGGLENVLQLFRSNLEKMQVVGFSAVGEHFDPNIHEAIRRVEDANVPNQQVVEEYHKGYHIEERLLRPALVVVAFGGPAAEPSDPD